MSACGALLVLGYFLISEVEPANEITPAQTARQVNTGGTDDATLAAASDQQATASSAADEASAANSVAQPPSSQTNPAKVPTPKTAAPASPLSKAPPLSKAQLDELIDRHDCTNVPRTPARLASDLEYFDLASEKWSDAMLAAYQIDLTSAPTGSAKANSIRTVSALMQRCVKLDELLAAKPEGAPDTPNIDWSEYPELLVRMDGYDPALGQVSVAAAKIKALIRSAGQNLNNFTAVPGAGGDLAYRDLRALQILGVPLSKGDQAGLNLLQQLLRVEIIDRAELEAKQLAQQIKAAR